MKIGIIGCGTIAGHHLPVVAANRHVREIAVCDSNLARAQALARRWDIKRVYTELDGMMARFRPDVVHVLTPPASHAALAMRAMNHGCHVLVEKPMALTSTEADAMADCASNNGVGLCVNHNLLWQPLMQRVCHLVDDGRLGELLHVDVHYGFDIGRARLGAGDAGGGRDAWLSGLEGGPLFDSMPHPASLLLRFLRQPMTVWATARDHGMLDGASDEIRAMVNAANASGALCLSLGSRPDCCTVTLYGSAMTVHANLSNMTLVLRRQRRYLPKAVSRGMDSLEHAWQLLFGTVRGSLGVAMGLQAPPGQVQSLINDFYQSLLLNTEPPVSANEGRSVVWFSGLIREQIAAGAWAPLSGVGPGAAAAGSAASRHDGEAPGKPGNGVSKPPAGRATDAMGNLDTGSRGDTGSRTDDTTNREAG